jgi:hypothetical protein
MTWTDDTILITGRIGRPPACEPEHPRPRVTRP